MMENMNLDLRQLKKMLMPLKSDPESPGYVRALVEKSTVLHNERRRISKIADQYQELPTDELRNKMMIGRRIIYLEDTCMELVELWFKLLDGDPNLKWTSHFEWEFSRAIANSCYEHIFSVAKKLENVFWTAGFSQIESAYLQLPAAKRRKEMPQRLTQVLGIIEINSQQGRNGVFCTN